MIAWVLVLWLGCGDDPCERMCEASAHAVSTCLEEEGRSWEGLGYVDAADYLDACDTWAWEQRLLLRDAGESEEALEASCTAWEEEPVDEECAAAWLR